MLRVSKILSASMADAYPDTASVLGQFQTLLTYVQALAIRSHEAHWNVKGPSFGPLHDLFGSYYEFIEGFVDTLAERIVQLDGVAKIGHITIPEIEAKTEIDWLNQIAGLTQILANKIKEAIEDETKDDPASQDILIEFSRELEKWLWKIESHLKTQA